MKKKQLSQFIRRQVFPLAVLGILAGIALGILFSLFLVPYVMSVLGIRVGGLRLHLYPAVLALSILAAALAVLCGVHTPVRMAAGISPAEAVRFRGIQVSADSMYKTRVSVGYRYRRTPCTKQGGMDICSGGWQRTS